MPHDWINSHLMPNILSQTTLQTEFCNNYLLTVSNKTMTGFWDGSGISWTICKQSAPRSRQITTPTPHHSMITGRMLFLAPNQQHQSTEGKGIYNSIKKQRQFYHRPRSPVIIATDQKPQNHTDTQATWQCIILTFAIFVVFEFFFRAAAKCTHASWRNPFFRKKIKLKLLSEWLLTAAPSITRSASLNPS